jgi:hypothetical protein
MRTKAAGDTSANLIVVVVDQGDDTWTSAAQSDS